MVGAATKRFESDIVKWRMTVGRSTGLSDVNSGYSETRLAYEKLMEQLKVAGIAEKDISVQPINRNPVYDNSGNVTGYSFQQSIYVISNDIATIEKLALNPDEMLQGRIALLSSNLEYYFSKLADIKKELLAEATQDAKARAVEIAKNSGIGLGRLRSARAGIFQITEPYSTEVTDYGIYNTIDPAEGRDGHRHDRVHSEVTMARITLLVAVLAAAMSAAGLASHRTDPGSPGRARRRSDPGLQGVRQLRLLAG